MIFNSASDIDAIGYDKIIEIPASGITYLMRIDTKRYNPSTDALSQPVWQIKKITETTVDGTTTTLIQYANGRNGYHFVAANYASYTYKFRED
ncbi:MAG: hypothetical protein J6X12_10345 [Paludibacteraceae bacterium]|jgi:hypothetical protein|nr:hypothetical protein [Paludibacteraceae bacterium]